MSSTVTLNIDPQRAREDVTRVALRGEARETIQRFRDIRDDERRRLGYEVTNEDMLDMLMDCFALHREGR